MSMYVEELMSMKMVCALAIGFVLLASVIIADQVDWKAQADFYTSNYPYSSSNEKAQMLIASMKQAGEKPYVVEKVYRVKVLYVYDSSGKLIFPVKEMIKKKSGNFKGVDSTLKELDLFGKKGKDKR